MKKSLNFSDKLSKKAIVLDVDGVIVGSKKGINSPHPYRDVLEKLKQVRYLGIPVILCTAKNAFGIRYEIKEADLHNPHIADCGGLLIDNAGKVYKEQTFDKEVAKQIVIELLKNNIYTEVCTADNYYIQANQLCDITAQHTHVLEQEPIVVDSLVDICENKKITKIMQIVPNEEFKLFGDKVFKPFEEKANMVWAVHPPVLPLQFGFITPLGVSKPQGLKEISKILNIPLENMLGVGDSTSDWNFIEICGYAGVMGNATEELKYLAKVKGDGKYFIGDDVDNNGIIGIIDWFINK